MIDGAREMTAAGVKFRHLAWTYAFNVLDSALGSYYDVHSLTPLKRATINYQNAKSFLAQTNSIHALKRFRGAALKRCAACRRELIDNILIEEMKI